MIDITDLFWWSAAYPYTAPDVPDEAEDRSAWDDEHADDWEEWT